MAEATKPVRRRAKSTAKRTEQQADELRSGAEDQADEVEETTGDTADTARDQGEQDDGGDDRMTLTSELKETVREAAIEVLKPVMRKATTSAAKYAVTQGPSLVKDKVGPKLEEAGGAGELAKGLVSKGGGVTEKVGGMASGLGGAVGGLAGKLTGSEKGKGESPSGTGRGRRLPVQESIDVGVDVETAYDQFTQFEEWPKFMHRVERIEQRDDTTLMWHENIWGVRRSWEAEIVEQKPCERIVWRSSGGTQHVGVVTFHRLSDNLTRIIVTMDFQPKGLFEKTASGTRASRRALRSDLMRFKAFIEMGDEATGAWRGEIEEGEVVEEPGEEGKASEEGEEPEARGEEDFDEDEEGAFEDEEEEDEARASGDEEEEEDEGEEEPEASEEEDLDEEEEEEQPRSRRRRNGRPPRDEEEPEEEAKPKRKPARTPRRRSTTAASSKRRSSRS